MVQALDSPPAGGAGAARRGAAPGVPCPVGKPLAGGALHAAFLLTSGALLAPADPARADGPRFGAGAPRVGPSVMPRSAAASALAWVEDRAAPGSGVVKVEPGAAQFIFAVRLTENGSSVDLTLSYSAATLELLRAGPRAEAAAPLAARAAAAFAAPVPCAPSLAAALLGALEAVANGIAAPAPAQ